MAALVILKMTKQMIAMLMLMMTTITGWNMIAVEMQISSFVLTARTWMKRAKMILMTVNQQRKQV